MSQFERFGSPELFEIAIRWTGDDEPYERLPRSTGWSMGDLQITVGHQVLTARKFGEGEQGYLSWYLYPVLDWLISKWTWLFHEQHYTWPEKSGMPAAMAAFAALGRTIGSPDESEQHEYRLVHGWWERHALRAADSSALYPDVCFRRMGDDLEISWSELQPVFAPDGMVLMLAPGVANLAVAAVAGPLWEFLRWALNTAPATTGADLEILQELKLRFRRLQRVPLQELESRYLDGRLKELLAKASRKVRWKNTSELVKDIPAIASLDEAVLMFGGLTPSITEQDAVQLLRFLKRHQSGVELEEVSSLVDSRPLNLTIPPYQDGYQLAEDTREDLEIPALEEVVNIQGVLHQLGIDVNEVALDTGAVRGVAIAGPGFSPAILVNTSSPFNKTQQGRKFTMAHELCHILFDRSRAKRLSHVSGAWTSPRVEKRANAFAAMFLASRAAVKRSFNGADPLKIKHQAETLELGYSALIEHLFNLGLIDEADRDQLRFAPVQ